MKYRSILIIAFLSFLTISARAQSGIQFNKSADEFFRIQSRYAGPSSKKTSMSEIDGSPYLNDKYYPGNIVTTSKITYVDIPLRYNIYSDNFEFKIPNHEALELSDPSSIKEVIMPDGTYLFVPFMNKMNKRSLGFLKKLNDGKGKVLIHYTIQLIPAKQAGAYQQPEPPKFAGEQKFYYVFFGTEPAVRIMNKSDLINAFPSHRLEIERFIKKDKIKIRKQQDLVKLMDYYNSLN
ncbi:MAG: hypothetical protein JXR65_12475 [Bacteroidales bacterium]|nr:hypothetical protein [Bacteroidales bacterium]